MVYLVPGTVHDVILPYDTSHDTNIYYDYGHGSRVKVVEAVPDERPAHTIEAGIIYRYHIINHDNSDNIIPGTRYDTYQVNMILQYEPGTRCDI